MSRVIDEHRLYLRDRHRVSAYERAIREVVRPRDVVVDLASGTGILGMLACRAGASRVYAIEESGIAGLARQIARANGFERIITSVRGNSRQVSLPERADVVVCDQIGGFGLEAGILEIAKDARQRFLRPGGTLVPGALELVIAPVEHAVLYGRVRFWKERPAGFDYAPAVDWRPTPAIPSDWGPGICCRRPSRRPRLTWLSIPPAAAADRCARRLARRCTARDCRLVRVPRFVPVAIRGRDVRHRGGHALQSLKAGTLNRDIQP